VRERVGCEVASSRVDHHCLGSGQTPATLDLSSAHPRRGSRPHPAEKLMAHGYGRQASKERATRDEQVGFDLDQRGKEGPAGIRKFREKKTGPARLSVTGRRRQAEPGSSHHSSSGRKANGASADVITSHSRRPVPSLAAPDGWVTALGRGKRGERGKEGGAMEAKSSPIWAHRTARRPSALLAMHVCMAACLCPPEQLARPFALAC
jgi:hypothetical protein